MVRVTSLSVKTEENKLEKDCEEYEWSIMIYSLIVVEMQNVSRLQLRLQSPL